MSGGAVSVGENDAPSYKRVLQNLNASMRKEGSDLCVFDAI